ncbi:MAG: fluoride efflux transporter CrcB [Burkholderiales bacterium]|nr:fluoride efflux transporter CrcB [Burkholderiales bacterium]
MQLSALAAVGLGAVLGAWARWGLGAALNALVPNLPLGTLVANLAGGYLVGVAVAQFDQIAGLPPEARLFVITGFLGALTTFSTFSAESVSLLQTGRYGWAVAHAGAHLLGSLAMTVLGLETVRVLRG